jgi:hypothetical protein
MLFCRLVFMWLIEMSIQLNWVVIFAVMAFINACYLIIDMAILVDASNDAEVELKSLKIALNEM